MTLTAKHQEILRALRENHLAMRLPASKARDDLKDAGYIAGGRSGNWRADRRHTYWSLTPAGQRGSFDFFAARKHSGRLTQGNVDGRF